MSTEKNTEYADLETYREKLITALEANVRSTASFLQLMELADINIDQELIKLLSSELRTCEITVDALCCAIGRSMDEVA